MHGVGAGVFVLLLLLYACTCLSCSGVGERGAVEGGQRALFCACVAESLQACRESVETTARII